MVRDKIPEIIESDGKSYLTHIAGESEYKEMLYKKLLEEVGEFIEEPCMEEIADIYEVLDSIIEFHKFDKDVLNKIQLSKRDKRGSFNGRIILEHVK